LRELSLHLLDIAENSVAAGATRIGIMVKEDTVKDRLFLSVEDNGKGMDDKMVASVVDPFVTTRTTRKVGLGIPLLKEAAESCNGTFTIISKIGVGTRIEVTFQRSHIDRMPIGDLADTYTTLVVSSPEINWHLGYRKDDFEFTYDQELIRKELGEIPITDPAVLKFIRSNFVEGINQP
jgi:hypothetical protein